MPEKQRGSVSDRLAKIGGYTPTSEAQERANKRVEKALQEGRGEVLKSLFSEPVNPLEDVVPAWEAYRKYSEQNDEIGRVAKLAWRPTSDLIFLLKRMGVELVGFNGKDGPETVPYDPGLQKPAPQQTVNKDGVTTFDANPEWEKGALVKVIVPGIKDVKTGRYFRYPVVDQVNK